MTGIGDKVAKYYPALGRLAAGKHAAGRDSGSGAKATESGLSSSALSPSALDRFGAALLSLQRGLTGDRRLAGASYFSRADLLGAYLLYYWPVSFVQASLALREIDLRGALPKICRVLDLGAGPGPASFAAAELGAESVTLVDANAEALEAALRLKENVAGLRAEFVAVQRNFEKDGDIPAGPYDLIIACHSANELWKEKDDAVERRAGLFESAFGQLADGGILLVIEPAANVTGRPALALRDRLLERGRERGMSCVAPCPGSMDCPIASAGEGRSCHSSWPWEPTGPVAALARAAGLDRDSAKATWFAMKKVLLSEAKPIVSDRLAGRIVSESMLNKAGRVRYIVCTASGLATVSAKRGDSGADSAGFFSLCRGDCIEAEALEKRLGENSFGFAAGTRLKITLKAPVA